MKKEPCNRNPTNIVGNPFIKSPKTTHGFVDGTDFDMDHARNILNRAAGKELSENDVYDICYAIRDICGFPAAIHGFLVLCQIDPKRAKQYITDLSEKFI